MTRPVSPRAARRPLIDAPAVWCSMALGATASLFLLPATSANAACPRVNTPVPFAQLMAETKTFAGCPVKTKVSFVATGTGPGAPAFRARGGVFFRVMPPGRSPARNALGGSDAALCLGSKDVARQLYSARPGQILTLLGSMQYKRLGGAFGIGGRDLGNSSRLFRVSALQLERPPARRPAPPTAVTQPAPRNDLEVGKGQLVVTSNPPGARVSLDGQALGKAPASKAEILPGQHLLMARWGNGAGVVQIEVVRGGASRLVTVTRPSAARMVGAGAVERVRKTPLRGKGKGQLVIVSRPAGAKVSVDGKSIGKTPTTRAKLLPGMHLLQVRFSDGSVIKVPVSVTAGISRLLFFKSPKIQAAEAKKEAKEQASRRAVQRAKAAEEASTAAGRAKLAAERRIVAEEQGWQRDGSKGKLVIFCRPAGAIISVDGVEVGKAPIQHSIIAGRHVVRAKWPDGSTAAQKVAVKPFRSTAVRMKAR